MAAETFTWKLELELSGVDAGWTDCTLDVSLMDGNIEVTDGMQSASLIDLLANPGSLAWVFDNSPANSAKLAGYYSPGHANCRAGFAKNIRCRYSEYYNSTRYYMGVYWLKKPIPSAGLFGEAVTRCKATDWLELMMNVPLPAVGVQTDKTGDQLLTTLLALVSTQPASTDFDTGDSTFATAFDTDDVDKDSVYSILGKLARSEYGRIYLQPSTGGGGVLKFEHRNARLGNVTSLGTISNVMDDAVVIDDAGQVFDRFQVRITPRRVDTSLVTVAVLNYHIYLNPGEEKSFTLNYVEQVSGSRISAQGVVTPMVAGTDYKFGTVDDGTTQDLNANLGITYTRIGSNSSDLKAKNNGAGGGYVNLFGMRGYGIYPFNPYTVEVGTGGLRVQTLDMPYQNNPLTADSVANYLQSIASNNALRACRVNFHANKSAALMAAAMTGLISTRWTIAETQTALGGDYFINGRKRTVSLGNRLDVEWLMSPAGNAGAWVLGTSALDVDTVLTV